MNKQKEEIVGPRKQLSVIPFPTVQLLEAILMVDGQPTTTTKQEATTRTTT